MHLKRTCIDSKGDVTMATSVQNGTVSKNRFTVKRVMIFLIMLMVFCVVRMAVLYHHPSIDARDIASQIDRSVYFLSDVGVVDIKTGKVFQTVGSPFLWDDLHQRAAASYSMQDDASRYSGIRKVVHIIDMVIDNDTYRLSTAPHMWSSDNTGRWLTTTQYLIDVKNRKITKPQMPGYIARASNTNDGFWFHTDGALVLWNAVSQQVVNKVAIPDIDQPYLVGDFMFDVSPDGKSAVFCIKTNGSLLMPLGIEYGLVNLKTRGVRKFRLNDVMAGTNPTLIVFLDNRHLLIVTMRSKYYVDLHDGKTWRIADSVKFPRSMLRTYRCRFNEPTK